MDKWIVWILLEATTVFSIASIVLLWRVLALKRNKESSATETEVSSEAMDSEGTNTKLEQPVSYKTFANKLDVQANETADRLAFLRDSDDLKAVTELKLWGTLLKAERAIVLNDATAKPQQILDRFMANIIQSIEGVQAKNLDKDAISKNLEDMDAEFSQASELLISKESLIDNQKALHDELRANIDRATDKIKRLNIKAIELQRLSKDLSLLREHIKKLEHTNEESYDIATPKEIEQHNHHASRHLHKLQRLSERQQAIIDQLQSQLVDGKSSTTETEKEEVNQLALQRMERLANESNSLIGQLQAELESANLSINALKDDIHYKDSQLKALDEKLKQTESNGVLDEFLALHSTKQTAIDSLIGNLATVKNHSSEPVNSLAEQEKEVKNLEHMLKESETCVQLLAQELDSAEKQNTSLREEIEQQRVEKNASKDHSSPLTELDALRQANRDLVNKVNKIKESLLSEVTGSTEKELRNTYNKKSLELDRLQLAYSDLERKYLGTLR